MTEAFTQLSDAGDVAPQQKSTSRGKVTRSKVVHKEPITEAFTQLSDDEWDNSPAKRTKLEDDKIEVASKKVAEDLAVARRTFAEKQAAKDPLLAALGESPPRVISKAGARAADSFESGKAHPSSPLPPQEPTWQRRAPKRGASTAVDAKSPKRTIIESRPTAHTVHQQLRNNLRQYFKLFA